MFDAIRALIPKLFEGARPRTAEGHSSWLATAALLTRVATVHDEMSAERREKLYALLKAAFQLDDLTVAQLIDQSAEVARNAVDFYRFTRTLREVLDNEGHYQTVRMMWEIVYAGGKPNEFEANIIWRAADLLGCHRDNVSRFVNGRWLTMPPWRGCRRLQARADLQL